MNKILITGGAGFVGYFLSKKLLEDKDNELVLIDNLMYKQSDSALTSLLQRKEVNLIQGDLTDSSLFEKLEKDFDYIYHLAAVKFNMSNPEISDRILYVNSISTLKILEFARLQKNLKNFMYSSTGEVYAGTQKHYGINIPTDENVNIVIDDLKAERTTYTLTKILGESACFNYGKNNNIPFKIIRFHNLYGPRMGFFGLIPDTFRKINENPVVPVFSPNHTRDFTYIDDAVEMVIRICNTEMESHEIFNIGSPQEEISIKELVKKIARVMNKEIEIVEKMDTSNAPPRRCADTSKIDSILKYERKIKLDEGLKYTYDWYNEHSR